MDDFDQNVVSVAIGDLKSKIENVLAGVVQWQNGSFPSCTRGFDSLHPLGFTVRDLTVAGQMTKK